MVLKDNTLYMDTIKRLDKRYSPFLIIKIVFYILGLVCTGLVGFSNVVADGLGAFFLLPLSFTVACMLSHNTIVYAKDSFGLLILYGLITLRYLVSPVLTALSGNLVPNVSTSASGLRYAVLFMIVELFVVVIAINVIWKPVLTENFKRKSYNEFKLTWSGAIVCLFLIVALLYRGTLPNVMEHLSFGNKYSYAYSELKTYDMSAVLTLKAFLFILIVSWSYKKYYNTKSRSNKTLFLIIAILSALGNAMVYDASDRATMVMCAVASLSVLLYCFSKKISKLMPIIAVLGFVFVWSLFADGTLGVKEGDSLLDRADYISELSRVAELYSNGVSTEAHAFDMYETITANIGIKTHISELIKSNNIFTLPGLWLVRRLVETIPSIQNLFKSTLRERDAFILPNAGLAMYSGSIYFGLLLDIAFHWLIVLGIYYFYKKKKNSHDLSLIYLYSYCEMICGFILMNNIMIAVSLLSAIPFLLYILLKLNKLGKKVRFR